LRYTQKLPERRTTFATQKFASYRFGFRNGALALGARAWLLRGLASARSG
jgi:hypothetical protein